MSALYAMRYLGQAGAGAGAIYIGKGIVVGIDIAGGRYNGTYAEESGRIRGKATLSMPAGSVLVTGQQIPQPMDIDVAVDWPANFADGSAQTINVAGRPVQVAFEKIGDIP